MDYEDAVAGEGEVGPEGWDGAGADWREGIGIC